MVVIPVALQLARRPQRILDLLAGHESRHGPSHEPVPASRGRAATGSSNPPAAPSASSSYDLERIRRAGPTSEHAPDLPAIDLHGGAGHVRRRRPRAGTRRPGRTRRRLAVTAHRDRAFDFAFASAAEMPCFLRVDLVELHGRGRCRGGPGMIWLTRIFDGASSRASVLASADTDARSTVESPRFGIGSLTDEEVETRIAPPPREVIDGTAARIIRSVLNSSRFAASCHAASSNDSDGPAGGPPPLHSSRSTPPNFSIVAVAHFWMSRGGLDVHRHRERLATQPSRAAACDRRLVARRDRDDRPFSRERLRDGEAEPLARPARPSRPSPSTPVP